MITRYRSLAEKNNFILSWFSTFKRSFVYYLVLGLDKYE